MPRSSIDTVADQLFFTTVHIQTTTESGHTSGTGFLITYQQPDGAVIVLVTNKHVLVGALEVTFTLVAGDGDRPLMQGTQTTVPGFHAGLWIGHPNESVDVAVMNFSPILQDMYDRGSPAFTRAFETSQLITQSEAEELDSIEAITFVGYPSGIYDTASFQPIARRGNTATPIFNDYRGEPAFLIDASVYPGSSGSPVVLFDNGMYVTRNGSATVGVRLKLLGVVAAVHTRIVAGEVIMTSHGTSVFSDPINLGIVYKSSAIQECVRLLFAAAGRRVEGVEPHPSDLA
ncbi:trypsin-like peptidase domain-containing protein [Clavibacter michiganensis subsp. phaseoli]|uniref:Trypsin-like peptidase domain-containing protein n=1 Tax=Clavibacter phaseoli TaxID=1734031 RepID=A0A8I0SBG4_9MICO|nr:trypsin-like peptidase domain-containing protein [Clavibacter phaseoli]MBF4631378.1 trypsin-like peptidase domain-containing protein [Clavibacter phaseoli]